MSEQETKTFCISYQHQGRTWAADIRATDFNDARSRVRAIGTTGVVDGELVMTVPASFGFLVPLWCWFRNLFVART